MTEPERSGTAGRRPDPEDRRVRVVRPAENGRRVPALATGNHRAASEDTPRTVPGDREPPHSVRRHPADRPSGP